MAPMLTGIGSPTARAAGAGRLLGKWAPNPFLMASASCSWAKMMSLALTMPTLSLAIRGSPLEQARNLGDAFANHNHVLLHWFEGEGSNSEAMGLVPFKRLLPKMSGRVLGGHADGVRDRTPSHPSPPRPSRIQVHVLLIALRNLCWGILTKQQTFCHFCLIEVILLRNRKSNRTGGWSGARSSIAGRGVVSAAPEPTGRTGMRSLSPVGAAAGADERQRQEQTRDQHGPGVVRRGAGLGRRGSR